MIHSKQEKNLKLKRTISLFVQLLTHGFQRMISSIPIIECERFQKTNYFRN
ncbi:unnamed protein product [Paramecium sonneborni]|uniref:Uncharacterized protein n=1 Tax=Paramecium sonneborni TaxID=65129 RepID=A0A8S1RE63_9CILI|nr:unnamed protein product [Paramecium sonneborni]